VAGPPAPFRAYATGQQEAIGGPSAHATDAKRMLNPLESRLVALRSGEEFDSEVRAEPGLMKALEM